MASRAKEACNGVVRQRGQRGRRGANGGTQGQRGQGVYVVVVQVQALQVLQPVNRAVAPRDHVAPQVELVQPCDFNNI